MDRLILIFGLLLCSCSTLMPIAGGGLGGAIGAAVGGPPGAAVGGAAGVTGAQMAFPSNTVSQKDIDQRDEQQDVQISSLEDAIVEIKKQVGLNTDH